ncbi:hypothetical protein ACQPZJ_25110 [Actinoplanes sp. CA-054009]
MERLEPALRVLQELSATLESLGAVPLPLARYLRPPGRAVRLLGRMAGKPPPGDTARYRVTGRLAWPLSHGIALESSGQVLMAELRRSRGKNESGHLLDHEPGTLFLEQPHLAGSMAYPDVQPDGSARIIAEAGGAQGGSGAAYPLEDIVAASVRAYTSDPRWYAP